MPALVEFELNYQYISIRMTDAQIRLRGRLATAARPYIAKLEPSGKSPLVARRCRADGN
jgi:hypothetical protein